MGIITPGLIFWLFSCLVWQLRQRLHTSNLFCFQLCVWVQCFFLSCTCVCVRVFVDLDLVYLRFSLLKLSFKHFCVRRFGRKKVLSSLHCLQQADLYNIDRDEKKHPFFKINISTKLQSSLRCK